MGLIATESGESNFEPVSEGLHQAIAYSVYDLGTHFNERFSKSSHQILIMWELPGERIDIEKNGEKLNLPRAISKKYTLSLNEKANLRKDLQTWRGKSFTAEELKGFDLHKLLGVSCQIQIIHNKKDDKTYANITAIMPMPKGSNPLKPENPLRFYSIIDHGQNIPEGTPEWVTEIIKDCDEWATLKPIASGEPSDLSACNASTCAGTADRQADNFFPEDIPFESDNSTPGPTRIEGFDIYIAERIRALGDRAKAAREKFEIYIKWMATENSITVNQVKEQCPDAKNFWDSFIVWVKTTAKKPPADETKMKGWDKAEESQAPPAGAQETLPTATSRLLTESLTCPEDQEPRTVGWCRDNCLTNVDCQVWR